MTRMVVYAVAAENDPKTAQMMARDRSAGDTEGGGNRPPRAPTSSVNDPRASWLGNKNGGRAMNSTPVKAIRPARPSLTVKGSWLSMRVSRSPMDGDYCPKCGWTYFKSDPANKSGDGRDQKRNDCRIRDVQIR